MSKQASTDIFDELTLDFFDTQCNSDSHSESSGDVVSGTDQGARSTALGHDFGCFQGLPEFLPGAWMQSVVYEDFEHDMCPQFTLQPKGKAFFELESLLPSSQLTRFSDIKGQAIPENDVVLARAQYRLAGHLHSQSNAWLGVLEFVMALQQGEDGTVKCTLVLGTPLHTGWPCAALENAFAQFLARSLSTYLDDLVLPQIEQFRRTQYQAIELELGLIGLSVSAIAQFLEQLDSAPFAKIRKVTPIPTSRALSRADSICDRIEKDEILILRNLKQTYQNGSLATHLLALPLGALSFMQDTVCRAKNEEVACTLPSVRPVLDAIHAGLKNEFEKRGFRLTSDLEYSLFNRRWI